MNSYVVVVFLVQVYPMYTLLFLFDKSDNPRLILTVVSEVHYQEHQRNVWTEEFPENPDIAPGWPHRKSLRNTSRENISHADHVHCLF